MIDQKGKVAHVAEPITGKCKHTRYCACLCWQGHKHLHPAAVALLTELVPEVDRRKFVKMKFMGPTHSTALNFSLRNCNSLANQGSANTNLCLWSRTWCVRCPFPAVKCILSSLLSPDYDIASSLIVNDDQQDTTILVYLFIPNQLYTFRAISSPIIRSILLYLQHLILSTDIAAGRC